VATDEAASPQSEQQRLESLHAVREAAVGIVEAARRELLLLSFDLQPQLYDQPPFLEAVRRLVVSGQRPTIRILVVDAEPAIKHGHRLIELSRKLSSFIEIRCLASDDRGIAETFLLADQQSLLRQPLARIQQRTAVFAKHSPREGRQLGRQFLELWERAEPDLNFRQISL
jgi:hypothetical protein